MASFRPSPTPELSEGANRVRERVCSQLCRLLTVANVELERLNENITITELGLSSHPYYANDQPRPLGYVLGKPVVEFGPLGYYADA